MVYVCQPEPPFRNFVPGPVIYFGNKEESAQESREEEIVTLKNSCLKKGKFFLLRMKIVYMVNRRYPDLSSEE